MTARARLFPTYGKSSDREWSPIEPFFVPLRSQHLESLASGGLSPEDEAALNEESEWRTISTEDDASTSYVPNAMVLTLLDDVLSVESAYILRRALAGESQRCIALACGITQQSVQERLTVGVERLRLAARGEPLPKMKRSRMKHGPWLDEAPDEAREIPATARVFSLDEAREKAQIASARARATWETMLDAARERAARLREELANVEATLTTQGQPWTPARAAKELHSLNPNRRKRARKVLRKNGGVCR